MELDSVKNFPNITIFLEHFLEVDIIMYLFDFYSLQEIHKLSFDISINNI